MKKTLKICALCSMICAMLCGCGQMYNREPVGVGYDNNELKLSPCACMMVWQA